MLLTLRRFFLLISATLFRLVLFFSVSILVALTIYTNRSYFSDLLLRTNAYERFIPAFLETNKEQPITAAGALTLGDVTIANIVNNAFPATYLQTTVEGTIAATYDWLEGDVASLNFVIDISQNEEQLAEDLARFAIARLESLPECSNYSSATVDSFSTTCRPAFVDLGQEQEALKNELLSSVRLADKPQITPETLFDTTTPTFTKIPFYYSLAKLAWLPLLLILFISGAGIVLLSSQRKKGFRRLGSAIFSTGISLVFFTVVFSYVIPSFTGSVPIFQTSQRGIDGLLNDLGLELGRDYAQQTIVYSVPLVIIGGSIALLAKQKKADKYQKLEKKAGLANSNALKPHAQAQKRSKPPIQSSEISTTKPQKVQKHKKYRTIPKKEL